MGATAWTDESVYTDNKTKPTACFYCTSMRVAIISDHSECCKYYLSVITTEELNKVDIWGNTLLHTASDLASPNCLQILYESGLKMKPNHNKWTPLHSAMSSKCSITNKLKCVQYLLSVGADPNAQTNWNATPLHRAVDTAHPYEEHVQLVNVLLEAGTHPNIVDEWGRTPLFLIIQSIGHYMSVASESHYAAIIYNLRRYGADIQITPPDRSLLENASERVIEFVCEQLELPL
jgi:ankyrin repeat protein